MKILFFSPQKLTENLGISRVLIELQKELIEMGHQVDLVGLDEIVPEDTILSSANEYDWYHRVSSRLREYLLENCSKYDVVEYDYEFFPFDRSEFNANVLFVARTVLLVQHFADLTFPKPFTLRGLVGKIFKLKKRKNIQNYRIIAANKTVAHADLINVPNTYDQKLLLSQGIKDSKITVIPYGVTKERAELFEMTTAQIPPSPVVVSVGTFDYRKGAAHYPKILKTVAKEIPNVRFKLVGCQGMFQTEEQILSMFPKHLRDQVDLIMSFDRDKIAELLFNCSIGIFPSYVEGFPFGILEMQLAHVPVVAFDSPGAPMMVEPDLLVKAGDDLSMANKVISLLKDQSVLQQKRLTVHQSAKQFTWRKVASMTVEAYQKAIEAKLFAK